MSLPPVRLAENCCAILKTHRLYATPRAVLRRIYFPGTVLYAATGVSRRRVNSIVTHQTAAMPQSV